MEYFFILASVLLISPFVIRLSSSQNNKNKGNLKVIFLFLLFLQLILSFKIAFAYPQSLLGLFFVVTIVQIILLFLNHKFYTFAVILNFINTTIFFAGMIRLGQITGIQDTSLASIGTAFTILIGNVIGLIFINKDKNLFKRYSPQKGFSLIPLVVIIGIIVAGVIFDLQRDNSILLDQLSEIGSTKISRQLAVDNVKKLPEVQKYLKEVPNGKVEVDNELDGEYNVHVYEVKNGHTATFNWYKVSIKSGEVRSEFPTEQVEKSPKIPTGTISGKICYPSEVVPKGKLEVKRLLDGYIISEDYPGSTGTKPVYSFQLEPGDYYIRYNIDDKSFGYSTTVCPTGNETTCADTKQRVPVMAVVKTDQELKNYDLCDYYYKDSNAPKF